MTETPCAVDGCGYPAHDHRICRICQDQLVRDLAELPALLDEVFLTMARQASNGNRNGSRSTTPPLPYDPQASFALGVLRSTLVGWIRAIHDGTERWPADTLHDMARWLYGKSGRLLDHPAAEEACDEIKAAYRLCLRATDTGAPIRIYAGVCDAETENGRCEEAVYARPAWSTAVCRSCGTAHNVEKRREYMLAELDGMLLTAAEIAQMAVYLGELTGGRERARKLINKWHERERLPAHGVSRDGAPMFLFGETLAMLAQVQHEGRLAV